MEAKVLGRRAALGTVLLGGLALAACERPVYTVTNVAFGGRGTLQQRTAQIMQAAQEQNWQAQPIGPGRIRLIYTYTEHRIVLDAIFDETTFSLQYVSSSGLSYDGTNVHRAYNNWVRELERQIQIRSAG